MKRLGTNVAKIWRSSTASQVIPILISAKNSKLSVVRQRSRVKDDGATEACYGASRSFVEMPSELSFELLELQRRRSGTAGLSNFA